MALSREVVEHVARLAHVGLTEAEVDEMTRELSSVIDHVNKLQELDTSEVEPTSHVVVMANRMREDRVSPSWKPAAVLANAPRRDASFFEVQAILD